MIDQRRREITVVGQKGRESLAQSKRSSDTI